VKNQEKSGKICKNMGMVGEAWGRPPLKGKKNLIKKKNNTTKE
jgi:hypothetical protein